MKLHFLGANRQVTGSRYCLEIDDTRLMVDCGLFQERAFLDRNWDTCPLPPGSVAALLLTHAHIDHCGLIPRLVAQGFRGPIYATPPTIDLAGIMLEDSAEIQEEDAAYKRRRHEREGRRGKHPEKALYSPRDVRKAVKLLRPVRYGHPLELPGGVTAIYHDAGHILGSAEIELIAGSGEHQRRIVFSGDLGQWDKPLIRDPSLLKQADYVIMESTYGDREHPEAGGIADQLALAIGETLKRGGNVVIPTFAVERAQELLYYISSLIRSGQIPDVPVFLDSPMAVDVNEVFHKFRAYYDEAALMRISGGDTPLKFHSLTLARTVEESKAINRLQEPAIIMATSGMCTGGRIKHHLRQNVGRAESTILFVGYQAPGTLGRQILDRNDEVRIHGRNHPLRAHVEQIYGFSAHADHNDLLRWLHSFEKRPRELFLTHGDEDVALRLADELRANMGWQVTVPTYGQAVELD